MSSNKEKIRKLQSLAKNSTYENERSNAREAIKKLKEKDPTSLRTSDSLSTKTNTNPTQYQTPKSTTTSSGSSSESCVIGALLIGGLIFLVIMGIVEGIKFLVDVISSFFLKK